MANDSGVDPIGGSFYANLSKHSNCLTEGGKSHPKKSSYDNLINPHTSPAGGMANKFAKLNDLPPGMANRPSGDGVPAVDDANSILQRYDSANKLHRQYSVSGQFHSYNNMNIPRMVAASPGPGAFAPGFPRGGISPSPQGPPNLKLNAHTGNVSGLTSQSLEQRRLASDPKRRSFHAGMEGANTPLPVHPTPLGMPVTNPASGLERKDSQKRVGMYFKKINNEKDGLEYRKEGDTGESARHADYKSDATSTMCYVKPILLFDGEGGGKDGAGPTVEVDGCTVRYSRTPNEEIHKYDMSDLLYVKLASDVEVQSDSLDIIREHFVGGSNVGMIMADMDNPAADPPGWFSWLALKYVVKETFVRLDGGAEFTMSACLLQEDQVMDLFETASSPSFGPLKVAESPFFGNVAHGLTYILAGNAKEFNRSLGQALEVARTQMARTKDEEQGIVLVTCLLKQLRSTREGGSDVWISSIFASGVGDGIIHYNRILDKNPAEPRAVFYAALHRSIYSTAIFSTGESSQGLYQCFTTLQRFGKVETRKPKVNSVSMFIHFAETTILKMKEDIPTMQNTPRYPMMVKFLEKMEIMLVDAKEMMANPRSCVPKTYT
ncbi:unnamed protein product [Phytomonas sp. Hart1]|nr:unnamed protein product [Phytomonas sp. Hart1]|eukprot:CCW70806.1 unnamed protein product [Phytomonas sp. isolate Hart1]